MWTYHQETGALLRDGAMEAVGYSGFGPGKNNPDAEAEQGVGPIPRGRWHIDRWDAHHGDKGPVVAVLSPVGHDAHGRSEFLIHGDSAKHPGEASHGCIIMSFVTREQMRDSGDTDLEVVA